MKLKFTLIAIVAMLSSFTFTANAQTVVGNFDELKVALENNSSEIVVENAMTIPAGETITVADGINVLLLNTLTNNGEIAGEGKITVGTMVYVEETRMPYPGVSYDVTATKNGAVSGNAPTCYVAYEISLDGGENWFTDTTNGKAQAVIVKKDGTKTISTSFQSAFTSAECGEIVHMLKDAHVQSTNTSKNNGPLRSYYGLILEGNGHTIYTDLEASGAHKEYSTIKFTSYLAGTGADVRPVLKNVTIDSQKNAKADLDIVSGDVTFTVSLYNVNLLNKTANATLSILSGTSVVINKSNVKLFDSSIPAWDAGSANAIEFFSGDYSLSFNNKCKVYGGSFSKNAANYLVERAEISNVNGKYVVTCKEEKAEVAPNVNTTVDSEVANELVANEAVANNAVELPADVAEFTVQLTTVESDNENTTKVTFTVTPSNVIGEKVSAPSEAITFRLPVPAAWTGLAKVYHNAAELGIYNIEEENGAKFVEVSSANFSEFTIEQAASVAKIGDVKYATLEAAVAAAQSGDEIKLITDVTLAEVVTIPASKTLTIDLNGKSISMEESIIATAYAINNLGNLTIKDGVGGGSVNARGMYNGYGNGGENVASATITILGGTFNAKGTNGGGAAIFNYGVADIQGGTFTSVASYAIALQTGSTMTIGENAIITGGINSWQSTLTITGGTISNDKSGKHVVYAGESAVTINGGTFHNNNSGNATIMASGSTAAVKITGGTFTLNIVDASSSYLIDATSSATYTISGGSFTGGIRAQGGTKYEIAGGTFTNEYGNYNVYEGGDINISGGTFTGSYAQKFATDNLADGYELDENGTVVQVNYVAQIGETKYATLAAAVAAAQADETITLIADVETADGVVITDKKLTIDLNGNTYTVTEGASTNNRNFKINGTSVVTVKNGTMVAAGDYYSGAYGTVRTEGTANVTLTGLKLYNYRGNGLNIKACAGTTVTIENTEIYANYGGGIEAAGGTIVVNNGVTVEQKGMYTAPYNSMAISVNGGGEVTVNGGTFSTECITAEEANNQGTSHGPWVAGVLNSGGTLIINSGTFSNDNFGENSLATAARGAILADTKAKVEINGGTFNVLKNVIDIQNNLGDTNNNPSVVLAGGTYNADPRISAQYGSNLITLADGYVCQANNDGTFAVELAPTDVKVATLEELQAALADSNELPIIITTQIVIPADETVTIDLNGKTVSMKDASAVAASRTMISNNGNLTIQSTVEGGKLSYEYTGVDLGTTYYANTVTSGPGSELTVLSGTIENLTYDKGVIAYAVDALTNGNGGDVTVNIEGGVITSKRQAVRVFANSTTCTGTLNISGGEFTGRVIVQNASAKANKAALNITGGTFNANEYKSDVLYVGGSQSATIDIDASVSGGTFNGEITETHVTGFITGGTYTTDVTVYCAEYFNCVRNENGTYSVEQDPNYISEFVMDDANSVDYTFTEEKYVGTLIYKRTLIEGIWNPLYLPFEVDVEELVENYDIAYYNQMISYDSDNNGSFDSYEMEIARITSGTLRANYPYFIRPKSAENCYLEYVVDDVTLYPALEKKIITSSVANIFTLSGTHKAMSASELNGYYTISVDGGWNPSSSGVKAHRLYLKIEENDNAPFLTTRAKSIRIVVAGEGNGTTGVENVTTENEVVEVIYDITGRRVLETEKGGLYIVNGKKVLVK